MMRLWQTMLRTVGHTSVMMKRGRRASFRVGFERRLTAKSDRVIFVVIEAAIGHRGTTRADVHIDGTIADGDILRSMTGIVERSAIPGIQT